DLRGLQSVPTKPKCQGCKILQNRELRASGGCRRRPNEANLHCSFTFVAGLAASWDKLGEWPACRSREVSRFLGNLDAARSAAAVRPGTTRKVEVRDAWRANPWGLKSVRTKPKSQGRKAISRRNLRASGGWPRATNEANLHGSFTFVGGLAASWDVGTNQSQPRPLARHVTTCG